MEKLDILVGAVNSLSSKVRDRLILKDYRPIGLIDCFVKIISKLLAKHLKSICLCC